MRYIVYGAGAVGSVLGGLLAAKKNDVLLVCHGDRAAAIRKNGLRIKSSTGEYHTHPDVTETLESEHLTGSDCVLLTVKSYDTDACARELEHILPADTPIVSMQNGIGNEDRLAEYFEHVYGGVCRMTCSMLQPGHASIRKLGRVIVGVHPKGTDAVAKAVGAAFEDAGFDTCVSRNIIADKWLKLALNTQSVFHAVIDPRDHDANEFDELKARILEETQRVMKAAKVKPKSYDGRDRSIDEMISDLRRPRGRRSGGGMKVHNSTWQDLYLRRKSIESAFIHGPLLAAAETHNVAAPYNSVALALAEKSLKDGNGPETVRLRDVLEEIDATIN